MQITIEPTPELTHVDGAPVRRWSGVTDTGVPCDVYVRLIRVHDGQPQTQFEALLQPVSDSVAHGLM